MSEHKAIEELEAELARDGERLHEIERSEAKLLADISQVGFRTAADKLHFRAEREMLEDTIRKNTILLAAAGDRSPRKGAIQMAITSDSVREIFKAE
jgi:hypothetical protein